MDVRRKAVVANVCVTILNWQHRRQKETQREKKARKEAETNRETEIDTWRDTGMERDRQNMQKAK